jgi:hypothetical protein
MKKFVCNEADEKGNNIPNTGCGEIDYVLFDGYHFGDRTLEDVMFKAYFEGDELKVDSVDTWEKDPYLKGLNKEHWIKLALEYAQDLDIAQCPKCKDDIAGPLYYKD